MHKAITATHSFDIETTDDGLMVNGEPFQWDLAQLDDRYFHIIHNQKSYRAEIVKADLATKTFTLKINGHRHEVTLKDRTDLLLERMGMTNLGAGKMNSVKAPMPGLIIDLKIGPGDEVKKNDPLLVLEAMKMENIIKSPGDGLVKTINVQKGDSVEKNQVLIEF